MPHYHSALTTWKSHGNQEHGFLQFVYSKGIEVEFMKGRSAWVVGGLRYRAGRFKSGQMQSDDWCTARTVGASHSCICAFGQVVKINANDSAT